MNFYGLFLSAASLCAAVPALCAEPVFQRDSFARSIGWQPGDSEVVIPAYVTEIPDFAFADCASLRSVSFAEGSACTAIGEYAFYCCRALADITLPPSLREIRQGAFRECESLGAVSLPDGFEDIKSFAFIYCTNLREINFPQSMTHIGLNAFSRCSSLVSAIIPDGVTEIESYAFADCTALSTARLPGNDALLGELIFNCCTSLTRLEAPSAVPPPFDCASFIFDPADSAAYSRCRLVTPDHDAYRTARGWNLFY